MLRAALAFAILLSSTGCFGEPDIVEVDGTGTSGGDPASSTSSGTPTADGSSGSPSGSGDGSSSGSDDGADTSPSDGALRLDVVIVIDNTIGTAGAQHRLASAMPWLVEALRSRAETVDVQVMVTTTDVGNPVCTPFQPLLYEPANGRPQTRPCYEHLSDFTSIAGDEIVEEACTDVCNDTFVLPDPFVRFGTTEDNLENVSLEQALQCLIPQGLNGCGFEAPLEAAVRALDPRGCWNEGSCQGTSGQPFVRPDADLAIVILTNELDCSIEDDALMDDPEFQEVNPLDGFPQATSALCFNAGVDCDGPDADGVYANCRVAEGNGMHPLSRYLEALVEDPIAAGKHVTLVPLVGIAVEGVEATVYRSWTEADLLPADVALGVTVESKTFQYRIGPGCTAPSEVGSYVQALPPVRIRALCESLQDVPDATCCMASVCDDSYRDALQCLAHSVPLR